MVCGMNEDGENDSNWLPLAAAVSLVLGGLRPADRTAPLQRRESGKVLLFQPKGTRPRFDAPYAARSADGTSSGRAQRSGRILEAGTRPPRK